MAYLNKVMIIGNVGQEPKIFNFQNGKRKASFSVAVTKRYRDSNEEQKEQTTWVNCSVFGGLTDVVEDYVGKGSQLYVEGELSVNNFTDQQGNKKTITEVRVTSLQMLCQVLGQRNSPSNANKSSGFATGDGFDEDDGDCPF